MLHPSRYPDPHDASLATSRRTFCTSFNIRTGAFCATSSAEHTAALAFAELRCLLALFGALIGAVVFVVNLQASAYSTPDEIICFLLGAKEWMLGIYASTQELLY
ncbi:uncharacterized protein CC84DRAFT_597676 [Paraphaeosphaeria sporulosa]|uniref:Uncharacterized protein n=1 Tax=Paraphaeosphaeria sporulosa TaxID=1460663 RepID=A0A177CN47_9PLEO|nr:uncharacterized protein CC84DRAFT_597676 [Paraphaeosphaeria sporulosa]OAG08924.1 hypothetical protein CC84DRAFT_597676 [Paraphaeosphaeria sporulosa]